MKNVELSQQIIELLEQSIKLTHQEVISLRNEMMVYRLEQEAVKHAVRAIEMYHNEGKESKKMVLGVAMSLITAGASLIVGILGLSK